jgi:hypothetical protein
MLRPIACPPSLPETGFRQAGQVFHSVKNLRLKGKTPLLGFFPTIFLPAGQHGPVLGSFSKDSKIYYTRFQAGVLNFL